MESRPRNDDAVEFVPHVARPESGIIPDVLNGVHLIHPTLTKPFHRDGYMYEEKYDGWRMVAYKDGRNVRLVSRRGVDHTARFGNVVAASAVSPPARSSSTVKSASSMNGSSVTCTC